MYFYYSLIAGIFIPFCQTSVLKFEPDKELKASARWTNYTGIIISYDPKDYHCGVDDDVPVDTNKVWKEDPYCYDYSKNMYNLGTTLYSCSDCIIYTCVENKTNNCLYTYWQKGVDTYKCCVDCDATVYPAGKEMKN